MVFSSLYFLFLYLPIVLFLYYITPLKWRNLLLLLVNLVFYAWGEPVYILIMFLSIGIDYTHGMLVEKYKRRGNDRGARWAVASSVIFNLALLFFFKYWDFVAGSLQAIGFSFMPKLGLSLPIGISFYTFQTMSYTIDVYRDDAKVQRSLVNFGTFVTLFPQLIAGPIIKYKDLGDQIDHRTHSPEQFASGVQIFVVGLAKKVLLANNIGKLWDTILALPARELTTAGAWLGVAAFAFQLYFDFSGYSDMAVGLGRMLGFEFMRNFNYPYIAKSVTEFWRRWHISLSTWLRDYLYISLGGNRKGRIRTYGNLLLTMLLGGLWHGAAVRFILWGGLHGAALALHKLWMALVPGAKATGTQMHWWSRAAGMLLTFNIVCLGWLMFRAESMQTVSLMLHQIFENFNAAMIPQVVTGYAAVFALIAAGYILHLLPSAVDAVAQRIVVHAPLVLQVLMAAAMIWCVMQIKSSDIQPFIYFQF